MTTPLLRFLTLLLLATAALLPGCKQSAPAAEEPVWGKQPCGHCAMLLSERLHGGQVLTQQGERQFFDDVGCLVAWEDQNPGKATQRWARQFDQDPKATGWLAVEQATFQKTAHTPMDFGYVAVAKPDPAQPTARWPDVVDAVHKKLQAP